MNLFEFIMVLVSIIISLGIAELLTGVVRLVRARDSTEYYWVHGVLTVTIFVALLQQWWETWGLREVPQWDFLALILMLIAPICLFMISHLLFPDAMAEADVEDHYYGPMRPVWVLGLVAIVGSTSFGPIVFGRSLFTLDNATSFLGIIVFTVLLFTSRRRAHAITLPLVLAALIYDVLWWEPVISQ
jgi:hypothetical protein